MRKVEFEMLGAIHARRDWGGGNTTVTFHGGTAGIIGTVLLHGHPIARLLANGEAEAVRETLAAWPTATTRSRLRALGFDAFIRQGRLHCSPLATVPSPWGHTA